MKDDVGGFGGGSGLQPGKWLKLSRPSLERFPLRDWLMARGFEPASRADETELLGDCPACGKRKLQVWCCGGESRWHCWTCQQTALGKDGKLHAVAGAGGVMVLIELLEGCDRERAWEIVGQHQAQLDLSQLGHIQTKVAVAPWRPTPLPAGAIPVDPRALHPYLVHRGVTPEDAHIHRLFWIPEQFPSRYQGRVLFPVRAPGTDVVIYWQARALREAYPGEQKFTKALNPKVLSPEHLGASDVLFNAHQAGWYGQGQRVVLVEAPLNVIRVGPDSVCSMGKNLSPAQAAILLQLVQPGALIVILYDGPKQKNGQWVGDTTKDALGAAQLLSATRDVRIAQLPWGDPADHPRAYNRHVIDHATPLHAFGGFWTPT